MEHLNFRFVSLFPWPARTSRVPQQQQLIMSAFVLDGGEMIIESTLKVEGSGFTSGEVFFRSLTLLPMTEDVAPERPKTGFCGFDLDWDCGMG
jgi:hypothetical protein